MISGMASFTRDNFYISTSSVGNLSRDKAFTFLDQVFDLKSLEIVYLSDHIHAPERFILLELNQEDIKISTRSYRLREHLLNFREIQAQETMHRPIRTTLELVLPSDALKNFLAATKELKHNSRKGISFKEGLATVTLNVGDLFCMTALTKGSQDRFTFQNAQVSYRYIEDTLIVASLSAYSAAACRPSDQKDFVKTEFSTAYEQYLATSINKGKGTEDIQLRPRQSRANQSLNSLQSLEDTTFELFSSKKPVHEGISEIALKPSYFNGLRIITKSTKDQIARISKKEAVTKKARQPLPKGASGSHFPVVETKKQATAKPKHSLGPFPGLLSFLTPEFPDKESQNTLIMEVIEEKWANIVRIKDSLRLDKQRRKHHMKH